MILHFVKLFEREAATEAIVEHGQQPRLIRIPPWRPKKRTRVFEAAGVELIKRNSVTRYAAGGWPGQGR